MPFANHPFLLGAHTSIAGGFEKALSRGELIGSTAIQIFTKNNRQWLAKPIDDASANLFKKKLKESSIQTVIAHASYLINVGSPNVQLKEKSTQALIDELIRCHKLTIPYLVLHPGTPENSINPEYLAEIAHQINNALESVPGTTMVLLETMAGQGNSIGYQFEQLAYIYMLIEHKDRIGICFDTCHVFAAGYDMRTKEDYEMVWNTFDRILGLPLLKVIHINDSKKECGSRVDRHEHIGKGKLGDVFFKLLFNDSRFFALPKILETPKETLIDDWQNMRHINDLITIENRKKLRIVIPDRILRQEEAIDKSLLES